MDKLKQLRLPNVWANIDKEADRIHAEISKAQERNENNLLWHKGISPVIVETLRVNGFVILDINYIGNTATKISW
jgi:hypothetical protein